MKLLSISLIALAISACGLQTYTSGVMPMGGNIFSVSADDLNPSVAKKAAFNQANTHCDRLGKEMLVIKTRESTKQPREYYDITFKCLNKDDPELRNHTYEPAADIVIEDRRR